MRATLARAAGVGSSIAAFLKRHDLIPPGRRAAPLRRLAPASPIHAASCLILWAVFLAFLSFWVAAHWGFLFDLGLQTDDSRILFPLHGLAVPGLFDGDPVGAEVSAYVTPGVWLLYRALTPLIGLYAASKVVQVACLAILLSAGALLIGSRRVGLAGGLLLVFLMLHTPFVPSRMAGGLPRSFAFPLFALWCAGALCRSERSRFGSALLAALAYPPGMAMILAAEGVFGLLQPPAAIRGWLKRYALLVGLCAVAGFAAMPSDGAGHIHTLAEARLEPAFGPEGRLKVLPFPEPIPAIAWSFAAPFLPAGSPVSAMLASVVEALGSTTALVFVAILLLLVAVRASPAPRAALAFFCGAVFVYVAARVLAFRLYSPVRFAEYGMPVAAMLLGASVVGLILPHLRSREWRASVRNLGAVAFMATLWLVNGDGLIINNGMTVSAYKEADLVEAIRGLPAGARVACHPHEADDVTYWGMRPATDGFETITVWLTGDWGRQRKRTQDTLEALYATNRQALLEYCRTYGVTHLLVRTDRYGRDLGRGAALFEPFDTLMHDRLAAATRPTLVVLQAPPDSIVFERTPFRLIDVETLRAAWTATGSEVTAAGD